MTKPSFHQLWKVQFWKWFSIFHCFHHAYNIFSPMLFSRKHSCCLFRPMRMPGSAGWFQTHSIIQLLHCNISSFPGSWLINIYIKKQLKWWYNVMRHSWSVFSPINTRRARSNNMILWFRCWYVATLFTVFATGAPLEESGELADSSGGENGVSQFLCDIILS